MYKIFVLINFICLLQNIVCEPSTQQLNNAFDNDLQKWRMDIKNGPDAGMYELHELTTFRLKHPKLCKLTGKIDSNSISCEIRFLNVKSFTLFVKSLFDNFIKVS